MSTQTNASTLAARLAAGMAAARAEAEAEQVVIRPAGAAPVGVRTSPTLAAQQQAQVPALRPAGAQGAANKGAVKGRAKPKAKARKPATPRRPLGAGLRERMRGARFRLLPLTIFVAVLLLGVRVGDLWRLVARDARLPEFPVTLAQGPQGATPATPPAGQAPAPAPQASTKPAAPAPAPAPSQGGASGPAGAAAANAPLQPLGPISDQELLKHFAERRAEIEARGKELEQREALLAAAEKRIDQKVAEMEKTRSDIQKLMSQGDEKQSTQLESLVKIYETMKPKEAARIFEELDMPVLLGVIQKMKEQKTAPILAAMDPLKAKEVTAALVERRVPLVAVPK